MSYKDRVKNSEYMKVYRLAHKSEFANKDRQYYKAHKEHIDKRNKEYYDSHRKESLARQRLYNIAHKEERAIYRKQYYSTHRDAIIQTHSLYMKGHKEEHYQYQVTYRNNVKMRVLSHYGNGICACVRCGYNDIRALSIDHLNGGGYQHKIRGGAGTGTSIYNWLTKRGYPEGYQTLCMNCQFIKRVETEELRKNVRIANSHNYTN
jgi:hypothetical protein